MKMTFALALLLSTTCSPICRAADAAPPPPYEDEVKLPCQYYGYCDFASKDEISGMTGEALIALVRAKIRECQHRNQTESDLSISGKHIKISASGRELFTQSIPSLRTSMIIPRPGTEAVRRRSTAAMIVDHPDRLKTDLALVILSIDPSYEDELKGALPSSPDQSNFRGALGPPSRDVPTTP